MIEIAKVMVYSPGPVVVILSATFANKFVATFGNNTAKQSIVGIPTDIPQLNYPRLNYLR